MKTEYSVLQKIEQKMQRVRESGTPVYKKTGIKTYQIQILFKKLKYYKIIQIIFLNLEELLNPKLNINYQSDSKRKEKENLNDSITKKLQYKFNKFPINGITQHIVLWCDCFHIS